MDLSEINEKLTNVIEKVNAFFSKHEQKFELFSLTDGTQLDIDKVEIGGIVKIGDIVQDAGEWILPDGRTVVVTAGLISEVKPAMQASQDVPASLEEVKTLMSAMEAKFKKEINSLKSELVVFKEVAETVSVVSKGLEKFSIQKPTEKVDAIDFDKMRAVDKYRAMKNGEI